jgi:hypothetical protein
MFLKVKINKMNDYCKSRITLKLQVKYILMYFCNWFQSNKPPISTSSSGSGSFGFSTAFGASAGLAAY